MPPIYGCHKQQPSSIHWQQRSTLSSGILHLASLRGRGGESKGGNATLAFSRGEWSNCACPCNAIGNLDPPASTVSCPDSWISCPYPGTGEEGGRRGGPHRNGSMGGAHLANCLHTCFWPQGQLSGRAGLRREIRVGRDASCAGLASVREELLAVRAIDAGSRCEHVR